MDNMSIEAKKEENTISKGILSIFLIIFLGAIGSGFWEMFLKDFLFFILDYVLSIIYSIFGSYGNSLYSDVGKNVSNRLLLLPSLFLILGFIVFGWGMTFYYNKLLHVYENLQDTVEQDEATLEDLEKDDKKIPFILRHRYIIQKFIYLNAIFITISYSYTLIEATNNAKAATYIDRCIEILHPYITENEFLKLRSAFRQVDTLDEFKNLYKKINDIGIAKKIELPDYSPLLVDKLHK